MMKINGQEDEKKAKKGIMNKKILNKFPKSKYMLCYLKCS